MPGRLIEFPYAVEAVVRSLYGETYVAPMRPTEIGLPIEHSLPNTFWGALFEKGRQAPIRNLDRTLSLPRPVSPRAQAWQLSRAKLREVLLEGTLQATVKSITSNEIDELPRAFWKTPMFELALSSDRFKASWVSGDRYSDFVRFDGWWFGIEKGDFEAWIIKVAAPAKTEPCSREPLSAQTEEADSQFDTATPAESVREPVGTDDISKPDLPKKQRRDAVGPEIIGALAALTALPDWNVSSDKDRCLLVNAHLKKTDGWCKVTSLRRAVAEWEKLGCHSATLVTSPSGESG